MIGNKNHPFKKGDFYTLGTDPVKRGHPAMSEVASRTIS